MCISTKLLSYQLSCNELKIIFYSVLVASPSSPPKHTAEHILNLLCFFGGLPLLPIHTSFKLRAFFRGALQITLNFPVF